jgi:hypothetical protein
MAERSGLLTHTAATERGLLCVADVSVRQIVRRQYVRLALLFHGHTSSWHYRIILNNRIAEGFSELDRVEW